MSKREKYLLKHYGITEKQYAELLSRQNGCCAICGQPASKFKTRLAVEHDHRTGQIRGLVCSYDNRRVIGRYRSPGGQEVLRRLIKYLDGPYPGWIVPPKSKRKKKRKKHVTRS